jgi:hypothetical protein
MPLGYIVKMISRTGIKIMELSQTEARRKAQDLRAQGKNAVATTAHRNHNDSIIIGGWSHTQAFWVVVIYDEISLDGSPRIFGGGHCGVIHP